MCLVLMTGNKCSRVMAFTEKWINKTDGVIETGWEAIDCLGTKGKIYLKVRFLSLL